MSSDEAVVGAAPEGVEAVAGIATVGARVEAESEAPKPEDELLAVMLVTLLVVARVTPEGVCGIVTTGVVVEPVTDIAAVNAVEAGVAVAAIVFAVVLKVAGIMARERPTAERVVPRPQAQ